MANTLCQLRSLSEQCKKKFEQRLAITISELQDDANAMLGDSTPPAIHRAVIISVALLKALYHRDLIMCGMLLEIAEECKAFSYLATFMFPMILKNFNISHDEFYKAKDFAEQIAFPESFTRHLINYFRSMPEDSGPSSMPSVPVLRLTSMQTAGRNETVALMQRRADMRRMQIRTVRPHSYCEFPGPYQADGPPFSMQEEFENDYAARSQTRKLYWDRKLFSPEMIAVVRPQGVHFMEEKEAQKMLERAVFDNNPAGVHDAISLGADINGYHDAEASTPLHLAAGRGLVRMIASLIDAGGDIEMKNIRGWTPLIIAASSGRQLALHRLLMSGASVYPKDDTGWTALHWAAWTGYTNTVRLLIRYCAPINEKDIYGRTPMGIAIRFKRRSVADYLRSKGGKQK